MIIVNLTEKEKEARKRVCLPLDNLYNLSDLGSRVRELADVVGMFKIGYGSFTRFGPDAVKLVQDCGAEVFLDLKYHDIPNTAKDSADAATQLGVYMFNVHASGGLEMMKAAAEEVKIASEKYKQRAPKIVAVTILTSIDENIMNNQLRIPGKVEDQVLNYAKLAKEAGLDGIVCSAADLYAVKDKLPKKFMYITPGIQNPSTSDVGSDQKRIFTPGRAIQDGSSILVVGRAITSPKNSDERVKAGYDILHDMAKYL
jgi:orotidine-5'-phosphate decarboxylase